MDFTKINWGVFLDTEKANLKKALAKDDYKALVVLIEEMTQEKEIELQKIVNVYRATNEDYESNVREEMKTTFHNKNVQDITPEEEAEWQKKLDAEKEKIKNNSLEKNEVKSKIIETITDEIDEPVKVEEPVVEEPVVEEPVVEEPVVEEPKKRGRKPKQDN